MAVYFASGPVGNVFETIADSYGSPIVDHGFW